MGHCTRAHCSPRCDADDCPTCCLCRAVPKESPFFLRARVALADIYLTHKHDRAAYARCYSDLVDKHGDFDSYRLYGEALLQIQEPERAIKVGEAANSSAASCTGTKSMPSWGVRPLFSVRGSGKVPAIRRPAASGRPHCTVRRQSRSSR